MSSEAKFRMVFQPILLNHVNNQDGAVFELAQALITHFNAPSRKEALGGAQAIISGFKKSLIN